MLAGWMVARWASRRLDAPMRETGGVSLADLEEMVARREDQLPSLAWSLAPVLTPILLIAGASFLGVLGAREHWPAAYAVRRIHRQPQSSPWSSAPALAVVLVMRQRELEHGQGDARSSGRPSPPRA